MCREARAEKSSKGGEKAKLSRPAAVRAKRLINGKMFRLLHSKWQVNKKEHRQYMPVFFTLPTKVMGMRVFDYFAVIQPRLLYHMKMSLSTLKFRRVQPHPAKNGGAGGWLNITEVFLYFSSVVLPPSSTIPTHHVALSFMKFLFTLQ